MTYQILLGNNIDILPTLPDNSVDSIVTDPPYELGFMGKKWDSSGIAYSVELWQQCLRVLKPGGHLLSFGGTRTWHRVAVGIEDAGFEIRDSMAWLYGSGFPKSLDVSKAIDKAAGAERERVELVSPGLNSGTANGWGKDGHSPTAPLAGTRQVDTPSTPEAQQWQGWGTALKPAFEPIVVARKPLGEGTVANNVLKWGTGGLNIDGSRISADMTEFYSKTGNPRSGKGHLEGYGATGEFGGDKANPPSPTGRWPANLIIDEDTAELLDQQSGTSTSRAGKSRTSNNDPTVFTSALNRTGQEHNDSGGASRFFYVAKASKRDRNEGLDELDPQRHSDRELADGVGGDNPRNRTNQAKQNFHPTVKPTTLMEYLIKLVTPPGGVVLDPFTGSGSTGKAAILQGFDFIGIEMTEEYLPIIEGRLKHAEALVAERIKEATNQQSEVLF
jgi:DNA modification methylase